MNIKKITDSSSKKTSKKTKNFIQSLLKFAIISLMYILAIIMLLYTLIDHINCHSALNINNILIVGLSIITTFFIKSKWHIFYLVLMIVTVGITLIFSDFRYLMADFLNPHQDGCYSFCGGNMCDAKPIIYLYPTKTTEVTVSLGNPQNLTHTYPKYTDSWTVTAEPNGDLFDKETNRSYYALYWEGLNTIQPNMNEGFVVEGKNTIPFLQEKLSELGLTKREANEFIIYWLPKMENAPYNFVRFQTMQEQNQNMPLAISPKPDTLIRVMMEFKNLSSPIEVKEQILPPTPNRKGFVAVEWGGTDVTTNRVQ